jgi:hypothetical protein
VLAVSTARLVGTRRGRDRLGEMTDEGEEWCSYDERKAELNAILRGWWAPRAVLAPLSSQRI